jgi:hypothetical protein
MEAALATQAHGGGAPSVERFSVEERLSRATEAAEIGWWDVEEGHGQLT